MKKKKKKRKRVRQIKDADVGLEGFMNWVDLIVSESTEEREDDMSNLTAELVAWMCKRATSTQGETTPGSKVPGGKRLKRFGLDEEVQKSPAVITVDSLERAPDALPTLEGVTQDASKEACALLENGALV